MNAEHDKIKWHPITWGFILLGAFAFLAAITVPCFVTQRHYVSQKSCINNLRIIDEAKREWAEANGKTNGDAVVMDEVNRYIRPNASPQCPDGGSYTYNVIGSNPTCTITSSPMHHLP